MNRPRNRLEIDILTLFPGMFSGPLTESLVGKARAKGILRVRLHDLRDYSLDRHGKVDDKKFGGGAGMVIQVEPVYRALKELKALPAPRSRRGRKPFVVYLSPQGAPLNQGILRSLLKKDRLVLLCGHYEGIDERAMNWVDQEISIGDYVLTGGELPAMVLVDALSRLVPGVVKEWESVTEDSFYEDRLDCSHFTRPKEFLDLKVPEVLLSGNHKEIAAWRRRDAMNNTIRKRPDLLLSGGPGKEKSS